MELMQKLNAGFFHAAWRPFPVQLLSTEMKRPEEGGAMPLGRTGDFDFLPLAKPAALDIWFIGPVRLISK
jgi:hypothetical protein